MRVAGQHSPRREPGVLQAQGIFNARRVLVHTATYLCLRRTLSLTPVYLRAGAASSVEVERLRLRRHDSPFDCQLSPSFMERGSLDGRTRPALRVVEGILPFRKAAR